MAGSTTDCPSRSSSLDLRSCSSSQTGVFGTQVETLASACKRVAGADRGEIAPLLNHGTVGDAGGDQRLLDRPFLAAAGCLLPPPLP
jgi:hypothetical protein